MLNICFYEIYLTDNYICVNVFINNLAESISRRPDAARGTNGAKWIGRESKGGKIILSNTPTDWT